MSDLHKIQITGRLGKDPERHDTAQFKEAKASIGVNNSYKVGSDWKSITTWYPVAFYGELADKAMKLTKGAKVFIDGKLSAKKFMSDKGEEVEYRKIVVSDFFVCGDAKESPRQAYKKPEPVHDDFEDIPF